MDEKVPVQQGNTNSVSMGILGLLGLCAGTALLIHSGYEMGVSQARKILKRHDKDFKRMEKREKRFFKEQKRKEKEGVF